MTIRVLVDHAADLPAARALQEQIAMRAPEAPKPRAPAARDAPWAEFFESVQDLLRVNGAAATDTAALRRMAPLGIGVSGGFDPRRFTTAEIAEIEAGVADARARVIGVRRAGPVVNGWAYPMDGLGAFGQDYLYRAQVALGGLGALTRIEAMYARPVGDAGTHVFDSAIPWRLHFPAGELPPVEGFWSMSLYEATPSGQFFFTPNPQRRYAVGDRTPGLKTNADGSLDIWISREIPRGERTANWLPAPASLPLTLVMRAYLPKSSLLDGTYRLPPLTRS